jgi:hypothetical protein
MDSSGRVGAKRVMPTLAYLPLKGSPDNIFSTREDAIERSPAHPMEAYSLNCLEA